MPGIVTDDIEIKFARQAAGVAVRLPWRRWLGRPWRRRQRLGRQRLRSAAHLHHGNDRRPRRHPDVLHGAGQRLHRSQGHSQQRLAPARSSANPVAQHRVLIASSFTLALARKLFKSNDQQGFRHWWSVTTVLGVLFLVGQIIAWRQLAPRACFWPRIRAAAFSTSSPPRTACTCWAECWRCTWILFRPTHRLTQGTATEVAAMYWHFMDGLWVFLFLLPIWDGES